MPRQFRFKCRFKCRKCGKVTPKMGSCQPARCSCGARKGTFELIEKIDLKKNKDR